MFILEKDTHLIDSIAYLNIKYQKACNIKYSSLYVAM